MKNLLSLSLACSLLLSPKSINADSGLVADSKKVSAVEYLYADVSDANSILAAIDSGLLSRYQGKDRAAWEQIYRNKRAKLAKELESLPISGLSDRDTAAIAAMRKQMKAFTGGGALFSPASKCKDAARKDIAYPALKSAVVACFVEIGNSLNFEGGKINRVSALDLLHETSDSNRRKAVFFTFIPLWQAINGNNEPDSPYRRMIAGAAAEAAKNGSEIDNAARDVGIDSAELERWLVQILDAWRESSGDAMIEPWDFRFQAGEADRMLGTYIPRESLQPINQRYYRDLGADLEQMGTLYDLSPRPEKAALAYTEFVTHGRIVNGAWKPTVARVSAPYERGGLFVLNELVHENGHVANITAIRNRPAFVDWPSDLFAEAFADVPAWSTYEPVWQRRYLGHEAPEQLSLRALYSMVVLDVAWSLFELRMFRAPSTDPNALWTEITSRYLHIVPHPELSWWAVRVQLADLPGYMVNYGLGAVLTAEMRQHIAEALGPFDMGDSRWYGWLSEQLLHYGSERDTRTLMQNFIDRPVSPRALLEQIHRLKVVTLQTAGGNDDLEQLKSQLQNIRQGFPGDMAVYMKNLKTGEEIALDADSIYETFSVIKIAIMADVLRQAEAGKFSLDDRISLKAADQRLPSGVLYTMQPGLNPTIRDLITLMIIISDNAATDLLADKAGRANITGYMQELGLNDTSIKFSDLDWDRTWLSTLDPSYKNAPGDKTIQFPFGKYSEAQIQSAFGQTIYNAGIYFGHSTAREIGHLLEMMQQNKLVSKASSEFMLATLEKQQVNNRFPKYLRNVLVAHKTGDGQPFIANDAGILFVKDQPVVLVVFTGHHRGETEALHDAVARVAALVAKHYGAELSPDYKPQ